MNNDFYGFVIYKIYTNGNIVVNHVVKDCSECAYNSVINLIYEKWNMRHDNVNDIILLTLPCVSPYSIENPIFRASDIGTDNEFNWHNFRKTYYDV